MSNYEPKQLSQWNVIEEGEFKKFVEQVFTQVSNTLSRSLGPYGSTTMIEEHGEHHFTKDGWTILKGILYTDPTKRNILALMRSISQQLVAKVGDGSTSSIVAAHYIYDALNNSKDFSKIRPRDIIKSLELLVMKLSEMINAKSTRVDVDGDYTDIFNLAKVSLNGDEELARMIQKVYKETSNPSIDFGISTDARSSVEIIEGFKAPIRFIDPIYATRDDGSLVEQSPLILMFDKIVTNDNHGTLISIMEQKAAEQGVRLIVIAPQYDSFILARIRDSANREMRANNTTRTVYASVSLSSNRDDILFNDFAVMAGATVVNQYKYNEIVTPTVDEINDPETETVAGFVHADTISLLWDCLGMVDSFEINRRSTMISGFSNRSEEMYDQVRRQAESDLNEVTLVNRELNTINSDFYEAKKRVSRLTGKMGRINVGGPSTLARKSINDLVDDAVKSCESAFRNGYNAGGNIIIPEVIDELLLVETDPSQILLANLLKGAFINTYETVLYNRFIASDEEDRALVSQIIKDTYDNRKCYDLTTDEFNELIINSSETDVEILRSTVSIVGLILSSNQYLSLVPNNTI